MDFVDLPSRTLEALIRTITDRGDTPCLAWARLLANLPASANIVQCDDCDGTGLEPFMDECQTCDGVGIVCLLADGTAVNPLEEFG